MNLSHAYTFETRCVCTFVRVPGRMEGYGRMEDGWMDVRVCAHRCVTCYPLSRPDEFVCFYDASATSTWQYFEK